MSKSEIHVSRRTALVAFGVGGAASMTMPALAAAPDSAKQASLAKAVESLRVAMLEGDGATLRALLHDRLNYMHSSGKSQSKADLLSDLAGKRFFAGLSYKDQTIDVVDNTGTVVQTVDQNKNLPDGKTRASQIKVLQTWLQAGGKWQLLSRVSAIIYSPMSARSCPPAAKPAG